MGFERYRIHLADAAGTDGIYYASIGRKVRLRGVLLTANVAATGHASNFVDVNVFASNASTLVWNRDTDSGSDGTLAAGTIEGLSPDASVDTAVTFETAVGDLMDYEATEPIKVTTVNSASGVALDAELVLILEHARD